MKWEWAMAAPKPEEISHQAMDQLQGLEYCIDSNPTWGMHKFDSFSQPHFSNQWLIHILQIFVCVQSFHITHFSFLHVKNRGGYSFGLPALHFGLRNCSYDPIIPCSSHGWQWCELILLFIHLSFILHVILLIKIL